MTWIKSAQPKTKSRVLLHWQFLVSFHEFLQTTSHVFQPFILPLTSWGWRHSGCCTSSEKQRWEKEDFLQKTNKQTNEKYHPSNPWVAELERSISHTFPRAEPIAVKAFLPKVSLTSSLKTLHPSPFSLQMSLVLNSSFGKERLVLVSKIDCFGIQSNLQLRTEVGNGFWFYLL